MPDAREHYKHFQRIATRWNDNDVYGHINNVEYYGYFDTVINTYLIKEEGWIFSLARSLAFAPSHTAAFCTSWHFPRPSKQACVWSISEGRACVME